MHWLPELTLRPVLTEIGGSVPVRGLYVVDSAYDDPAAYEPWLAAARRHDPAPGGGPCVGHGAEVQDQVVVAVVHLVAARLVELLRGVVRHDHLEVRRGRARARRPTPGASGAPRVPSPSPRRSSRVHSEETPTQSPWKAPRPRASTVAVLVPHGREGDLAGLEHRAAPGRRSGPPARRWPASRRRPRSACRTVDVGAGPSRRSTRDDRGQHQQGRLVASSSRRRRTPSACRRAGVHVGARRQRRARRTTRPTCVDRLVERHPGSPSASTELPREEKPPEARSTQSPSGSLSTGCQPGQGQPVGLDRVEPAVHATGRGGTGLPETMSAVGDLDQVALLAAYDDHAVGPRLADPQHVGHRRAARWGRSRRARTRRTTTRRPTTCGPRTGGSRVDPRATHRRSRWDTRLGPVRTGPNL